MQVSEMRVKQIRVNQGHGVHILCFYKSKTKETKRGRKFAIRSILCCQLSITKSTPPYCMVLEHFFFATVMSHGILLSFEVQIKDAC